MLEIIVTGKMSALKVGNKVGFREDYLFWNLTKTLMGTYGYQLITMTNTHNEIWLENEQSHMYPVVRLMRHDFNWANVLKNDLQRTAVNGENIRKKLFKKPLSVLNLYVTQFKPVDDYESLMKEEIENNKTKITSVLLDSESLVEELLSLEEKLAIPLRQLEDMPDEVEEEDVKRVKQETLAFAAQKRQEQQQVFSNGKPFFTKLFLLIQIIVFVLMEISGSSESTKTLVEFGAKFNPYILSGEWWRFITPIFVHIGVLHLLMNSVSLYYIGSEVEKIYGSLRFFFIYMFAGFAGVLGSFIFTPSLSAGASGAIFGCFGALLYFGLMYRKLFFRTMGLNIIVLILINLSFGFTMPGIDNAGHLGGLIGGFVAAAAVGLPKKMKPAYNLVAAILILGSSYWLLNYGMDKQRLTNQDNSITPLVQEYLADGETDKAKEVLTTFIDQQLISANAYFLLGNINIEEENYEEAALDYQEAIQLNEDFHQAYYNLSLVYLEQGELENAKANIEKAVELNPSDEAYEEMYATIMKVYNKQQ